MDDNAIKKEMIADLVSDIVDSEGITTYTEYQARKIADFLIRKGWRKTK